ncbi:MAG: signal peptide peptidase SppA [Opitutales bacterium]|nr:signal peptide peptidase SppA [Opitutales bacterium]
MRTFLKNVFKQGMLTLASMLFAVFFFYIITIILLVAAGNTFSKSFPKSAILVIDMDVSIPDAPLDSGPLGHMMGNNPFDGRIPLRTLTESIERAAKDKRIKGILLKGAGPWALDTGMNSVEEIRESLRSFQGSGKPVYAWLEDSGMRDYCLASVADEVWMHPMCFLGVEGFAAEKLFVGEAFERYGIRVQTASAGGYKSAPDMFTRSDMSEPDREQLSVFIQDVWSYYADSVFISRDVDRDALLGLSVDKGGVHAEEALAYGLIDRIGEEDELISTLSQLADGVEDDVAFSSIDVADYAMEAKMKTTASQHGSKVAVLYVEGEIVGGDGSWEQAGAARIVGKIRDLRSDDDVKAVVLRVNSPGGSALAAEQMRRELYLLAMDKPVVVSMGRMAASGGYWISASASYIYAEPTTLTGSIGVFSLFMDVEKLAGNYGVTTDTVVTSPFADMYSSFSEKDVAEMALARRSVDTIYDQFLRIVSEGRDIAYDDVATIAGGRIWSGQMALENGLVDELGSLDDAISRAVQLAGLDKDHQVVDIGVSVSLSEQLGGLFGSHARAALPMPESVQSAMGDFKGLSESRSVQARMPFFTSGAW